MTTIESPIMARKYEFIQKHVFNSEISHINMIKRCFDKIYPPHVTILRIKGNFYITY